jgi:hypothetical protein
MQTNLSKLAELLKITGDEAFKFYSEVRRLSAFEVSVGVVLINTLRYLREDEKINASPQEVTAFLDEHETKLRPKPIQVIKKPEAQPQGKLTAQKPIVHQTRHPLILPDADVVGEEIRCFIQQARIEYTSEFRQREVTTFYGLVKEHLEGKGVTGDPHTTVRRLDELTKATLHFRAIRCIYTEADAKMHCGMDYNKEFVHSHYWKMISQYLRLRQRDYRDQCPKCDESYPKVTEVHHNSYRNHGWEHEHLEDLEVICNRCHREISWDDKAKKIYEGQKRIEDGR